MKLSGSVCPVGMKLWFDPQYYINYCEHNTCNLLVGEAGESEVQS